MSDYFDRQLREGTTRVAGSLTLRTAAAVREHSKQRARRVGAVAGAIAASAALAIGGVVFGLERQGGGAAGATEVSHSTTASAPAPRQYVAGAWLGMSQLPYAGTVAWQVNPQDLGTRLGGPVQLVLPGSTFFDSFAGNFGTYCSIPALADQVVADQLESFYGQIVGSSVPSSPGIPATAIQNTVFYRSQGDAAAAWHAIESGFAACAKFETGRVSSEAATYPSTGTVRRIVNEPTVQCWTNLVAVSGMSPGKTDFLNDVCLVQHGTLISSVDLGFEGPATLSGLDFSTVDATVVARLEQALTAYDDH